MLAFVLICKMYFRETRTKTPKTANNDHWLDFAISYVNASKEQLLSVVESSSHCSYTFKYECHNTGMTGGVGLETYQGTRYYNWSNKYAEGMCKGKDEFLAQLANTAANHEQPMYEVYSVAVYIT